VLITEWDEGKQENLRLLDGPNRQNASSGEPDLMTLFACVKSVVLK
jgi:hypothetical protein